MQICIYKHYSELAQLTRDLTCSDQPRPQSNFKKIALASNDFKVILFGLSIVKQSKLIYAM